MFNQQMQDIQRNSAFRKLQTQCTDSSSSDLSTLSFTNEMMQVINAQNTLIMKLLERQNLLYHELNKRLSSTSSNSSGSGNQGGIPNNMSGYRQFHHQNLNRSGSPQGNQHSETKNNIKIIQNQIPVLVQAKLHNKTYNDENFQSDQSSSVYSYHSNFSRKKMGNEFKKKQTQTKNMVKNFSKAIFSYMHKNKEKLNQVLSYLGIKEQQFKVVFDRLRGRIHSIQQLRSLWIPEGNIYHKVFRIMSCDYLRKYSLQRTFNSRVENYTVHLKYRQRLLDGLKAPEQFTILKTT